MNSNLPKNPNFVNLEGHYFGNWRVLKYTGNKKYICRCICGNIKEVETFSLTSGRSTSCRCGVQITDRDAKRDITMYIDKIIGFKNTQIDVYIGNIKIDIYIPSKKLAIIIDSGINGTDKRASQKEAIALAKLGIKSIHLYNHEWLKPNFDLKIKNLLNRVIVPENNTVIHGRKTEVKLVEHKDVREFINSTHLQGDVTSGINYVLMHKDEIVGAMTFGPSRFSKSNYAEYELLRLVFKDNTVIVGGAEKLFRAFIKDYNPTYIVSFCDIAKFNGEVYLRLGFKPAVECITQPNYVWTNGKVALPRYQTMKHKLLAKGLGTPDMTETEIMESIGFSKVHDCGNLKFEWFAESNNG